MPCTRTLPTALLLALLAAAPVSAAPVRSLAERSADAAQSDYENDWQSAQSTARSGNLLGAMIAVERLMDDPRFEKLPPAQQAANAQVAGAVARMQRQPDLSRRYLERGLAAQPDNPETLVALMVLDISQDKATQAADRLIQASSRSSQPLAISAETVGYLQNSLRDQPAQRLAVLQALFDSGWKSDGVEPNALWLILAQLQIENGKGAQVPATVARIDTPVELIALRSDKRFDRYVDRGDARFNVEQAAQRHLDALRVSSLLDRAVNTQLVAFASAQLLAGENEQLVQFTEPMARMISEGRRPSDEEAKSLAWLLEHRMMALRRLGRIEPAVEAARMAQKVGMLTSDYLEHTFNLASVLSVTGHKQESQAVLAGVKDLSPFGQALRAYLDFNAALERGDAASADQARATIISLGDDVRLIHREMLIDDGDLDGAAAVLIAQLESPEERTSTLVSLQDMRVYPSLPAEAQSDERWRALKRRADVQAAVTRVGRIEQYPLYGSSSSR
ncbi:TPA: hypothetical protein QDZ34_000725 [Stenotrophomonas maltophilia]|nr:hypothetical protein [Stenotrophomonas maltophilia]HDS1027962.1 hypothetical protein [Stenotrophomonas maltophilia]HDS1029814.1 hypothetical protein [Stenotrophomonas maltophilia]HDS1033410.1 hypothetical protein [Stenotrophomonas maltophilia]